MDVESSGARGEEEQAAMGEEEREDRQQQQQVHSSARMPCLRLSRANSRLSDRS
jgi:hypothetical protein